MGVVEANPHLDSSFRTVASLNGSHSEARLGKKPMEDGECSYRPSSSKIMRRLVSAVRDFPPGCGRNAHLNNGIAGTSRSEPMESSSELEASVGGASESVPVENPVSGDRIDDGNELDDSDLMSVGPVGTRPALEDQVFDLPENQHRCSDDSTIVEGAIPVGTADQDEQFFSGEGIDDIQKVVNLIVSAAQVGGDSDLMDRGAAVCTVGTDTSAALEHQGSDLSKNHPLVRVATTDEEMVSVLSDGNFASTSVSNANGQEKTAAKRYPPRRHVSAVRDFPPFCGRNDVLEARNLGGEQSDMGDKPSSFNMNTFMQQAGEDEIQEEKFHKNESGGDVSKVTGDGVQVEEFHKNESEGNVSKVTGDGVQGEEFHKNESGGNVSEVTGDGVQEEEFHKTELGGNVTEVTRDGVQEEESHKNELRGNFPEVTECKGHAVEEMKRKDQCKVYSGMKVVLEDRRKRDFEPPQEGNGCQATREDCVHSEKKVGKQIVVYHENSPGGNNQGDRVIVMGMMAASNCLWPKAKEVEKPKPNGGMSGSKRKKTDGLSERNKKKLGGGVSESKQKTVDFECEPEGPKTTPRTKSNSKIRRKPQNGAGAIESTNQGTSQQLVIRDEDAIPISCYPHASHVYPPPFGQSSSSNEVRDNGAIVTRNKVRETLRLFQAVYRKLLQEDEAKSKEGGTSRRRFDLQAAKILKEKGKYVNIGKQLLGAVPGVEIGDEFHYRVELLMIGLHRQIQGGIDYVKHGGKILATSIVASGGYADSLDNSNTLIYTGQGGNVIYTGKEPEDQKLERGNLALKNSLNEKNPVRVIRGSESSDGKSRTYVYDGLYMVEKCWQDLGPHNKLVYKFQLDRIGGQPELAWKELKKSKKFQVREGVCVDDISGGKEPIPICAINTMDDEKPPSFEYITKVIYPDWCRPLPLLGCSCTAGCSDSENCSCAVLNKGEIPYNFNGAIVEAKPLVYECGPSCSCLPSCHNRVSQYGIKFQLEVFKTISRGWGVRSLNSISSGSFICEYIGELLEEKEAEARAGNDEYLFDIGNNYNDHSLWDGLSTLMPNTQLSSYEVVEEGCFTIDAARKGNLGRFINHSCSPNLYAQNVLYDHEDNRIPHIMFFAAENIPPLQELTYDYNYMIDQVRDSNGNIKKKNCYCGSPECTGRLY